MPLTGQGQSAKRIMSKSRVSSAFATGGIWPATLSLQGDHLPTPVTLPFSYERLSLLPFEKFS